MSDREWRLAEWPLSGSPAASMVSTVMTVIFLPLPSVAVHSEAAN